MWGPWNNMADLLDESIKKEYRKYFVILREGSTEVHEGCDRL